MSSHKSDTFLKIGEVRVPVASPKNAELVPAGFGELQCKKDLIPLPFQRTLTYHRELCRR